jgi:maleylacetoacetate isomerase/maleylpyruvate isomerase
MSLTLHSYWRATAPYRVRIGLRLKGLDYGYVGVNLLKGEQHAEDYVATRNRQHLTPALEVDGRVLTQSLAILEWLEETHPEPPLLPRDAFDRAAVRAMAGIVACDIHPLNNMRVQKAIAELGADAAAREAWSQRWIQGGFAALEPMVAKHGQGFAFGDTPTIADCCLVPQVYSAGRYNVDLTPFPAIVAAAEHAARHPAFAAAAPDAQPDAIHA